MGNLVASLGIATTLVGTTATATPPPPGVEESQVSIVESQESAAELNTTPVSETGTSTWKTGKHKTINDRDLLTGVDISSHQHHKELNHDELIDNNDFVFVKATEGTHYINDHFRDDAVKLLKAETPTGFYHYARPKTKPGDGAKQAEFFAKITGLDKGVRALPPVLDLEEDEGLTARELNRWTKDFVSRMEELTGLKTMIYTYPNFWKDQMGNTHDFNDLPLWIANYNDVDEPDNIPGGWDDWLFWQYTYQGDQDGIYGEVDENAFNGDKKDLEALQVSSLDEAAKKNKKEALKNKPNRVSKNIQDSKNSKTKTVTVTEKVPAPGI